ncbi:MAG: 1-(5-phosphoribosyl)-5-[(5-phosphoribosylamino)methylideneamino]imidazole-4-carboxamide isomerase [Nitrospiraceae bacterium]|nr:1-(5-phosphoribosyl)-5-[(5-phosphoribosylamino)methylideneamino]imidazole-4-carboxamide isomerase [Nitrospiraceae bacterium]
MLVIPAIDLKDGRCVRLRQGDMRLETMYSDDSSAMAQRWEQLGARLLHVVDLNGAIDGQPTNTVQIEAILKAVSIPVQIGGGIRTIDAIRRYVALGASRVVLGTAVLEDQALLERACADFPGRVLAGLDTRNGKVAVRGWTSISETSASILIERISPYPLAGIIYTDIARDGMLQGPNLSGLHDVAACSPFPVIASGGIARLDDIRAVRRLGPRIEGVIVGKALYDGQLDLRSASEAACGSGAPAC